MNKVLITADRIIAGPADRTALDGAVLIESGTVAAVGSAAELDAALDPQVPRLRCPGATVMPGMIDCHVHLAFDAGADPVGSVVRADPGELSTAMAERAGQMLAAGVTTVRDLGDRDALTVALRASIDSGARTGPRIVAATVPLTSPGGHCGFLGGEVSTDDDIRAQIARNAAAGADLIKVMASGGALHPPLCFSRSCNGAAGLRGRYDCVPSVDRMTWGVVSPGPAGAVGDADERPGHRPVRRNAGQFAGGRSA